MAMFPYDQFPATAAAIQDGIDRQLHTGVQIYVSANFTPVVNSAIGTSAPDQEMTSQTRMPWRSAGKPLTALLIMQLLETNQISLATRLADVLCESKKSDKADVTLFDLLTHQAGFPQTDTGWPHSEWSESISRILAEPRQLDVGVAAYHPQSSWFLLGEILQRLDLKSQSGGFTAILSRQILEPLKMTKSTCILEPESIKSQFQDSPCIYERDKGRLIESSYCRVPWISRLSPGASLRGPISELGRFYEMLLRGGKAESTDQMVSVESIRQMTNRHRVGKYDQTLQHTVDFGLGIVCNSNRYGIETVPYGFGKFASDATYGHGGSQCSMAFCDPAQSLVVAWAANGFCGEGQHQRRNRMINEAVYEDLKSL